MYNLNIVQIATTNGNGTTVHKAKSLEKYIPGVVEPTARTVGGGITTAAGLSFATKLTCYCLC
jgi:hypothetical protein